MNNWIEIAEEHLAANFRTLQEEAGPHTEVMAVVKANGYGHGAERSAVALVRAGARWLGVTCVSEGERVRQALTAAELDARLLVMCGFERAEVPLLVPLGLTPVVWTEEQAVWLRAHPVPIHLEIDTGMHRQGVRPGEPLARVLAAAEGLPIEGVQTHFACSEEANSPQTASQRQEFERAVAQIHATGLQPAWVHAGASSAIDNPAPPAEWLTRLAASAGARPMMRAGIALYGYCMAITHCADPMHRAQPHLRPRLLPVMTWRARVLSVQALAEGETVGYNATFRARAPMRIALLPVGFADGLRRELSSTTQRPGGWVMLHGQRANILGRISMNLTVVDVTGIPEAAPGDVATVLGEGVTADDHARLADTTAYEILCGVHPCG